MHKRNPPIARNQATIPELSGQPADAHYHSAEAERYTLVGHTLLIQHDLASRCLTILPLDASLQKNNLLLDIGCGSGLSSKVIDDIGYSWLGTDIASAMLTLAEANPACSGLVIQSDMGQGLPFKPHTFDGAISVSAVQWLCAAPNPQASIKTFFSTLFTSLKPGACASLQVYVMDDQGARWLVKGAETAGFLAGYYVDYPHQTPAKKYFLCLYKPDPQDCTKLGKNSDTMAAKCRCCVLAWPKSGSCLLQWTDFLKSLEHEHSSQLHHAQPVPKISCMVDNNTHKSSSNKNNQQQAVTTLRARLQDEHSHLACRLLRLLRRALDSNRIQQNIPASSIIHSSSSNGNGINISSANADSPEVVCIEAELMHKGLMPCGGAIVVHATVDSDTLHSLGDEIITSLSNGSSSASGICMHKEEEELGAKESQQNGDLGSHGELDEAAIEGIHQAAALVTWLVTNGCDGGGGGEKCEIMEESYRVLDCNLKEATPVAAALKNLSWVDELRQAFLDYKAQNNSSEEKKSSQFFRIEFSKHIQELVAECIDSTTIDSESVGLLVATKLPPLLVVALETSTASLTSSSDKNRRKQTAIEELCNGLGACVVGIDARFSSNGTCSTVWLLYKPELDNSMIAW